MDPKFTPTDDYIRCRFCRVWFLKNQATETKRSGKKFVRVTVCPRCGNDTRVEHQSRKRW